MKRFLCLLMALVLLSGTAAAEMAMEIETNYITFPDLDEMKCYFRQTSDWTIVTRDNYEEHMELLLSRGDTEEEIRARFAQDTLMWEAYKKGAPADACIRMECFEDDLSRDIWHLRHLSTSERRDFLESVNEDLVVPGYETYSAQYAGNGGTAYIDCNFTTIPPATHESGRMHLRYINGKAYVLTYCVYERMAGRRTIRTSLDKQIIDSYSPFRSLKFGAKLLPKMPDFALDAPFPLQADLGDVALTGQVTKGAKVKVTLDGKEVSCKVSSKGAFSLTLPVKEAGDHEVVFTTTLKNYTDRVETYTFRASADRTPLTFTAFPEEIALAGDQTIAGLSDPGAQIILRLDEREAVTLTADETGAFSHTFEIMDDQLHVLYIAASAQGKDVSMMEASFYTEYETFRDGLKAFEKQLTKLKISELEADPFAHLGERVKISVRVKEVFFTEEGLGILCNYNPPSGSKHAKTPLYLTLYGYAQDQIQPNMIMTVYATVHGQQTVEDETRMELLVQYGTYLVSN